MMRRLLAHDTILGTIQQQQRGCAELECSSAASLVVYKNLGREIKTSILKKGSQPTAKAKKLNAKSPKLNASPCCAPHHQAGLDYALLHVVHLVAALHGVDEHRGGLATHLVAALLHSGQGGHAGKGLVPVGEAANLHVARHLKAHVLAAVQDADGRLVVHGKEAVGTVVAVHDIGRDFLGHGAVVAVEHQALIHLQPVVIQGILVAIEAVLANLHVQIGAIESHTAAPVVNKVAHCIVAALIVVDHHAAAIDAGAYAVIKHQRHATLNQAVEVVILLSVLGLRHYDAAHLVLIKHLTGLNLTLIGLATLGHTHQVATALGLVFNAREHRREVVVHYLGHDHPDDVARGLLAVPQGGGNDVGEIIVLACKSLYLVALLPTDAGAVAQGTAHRGHRHAKHAGYIFHCKLRLLVHNAVQVLSISL